MFINPCVSRFLCPVLCVRCQGTKKKTIYFFGWDKLVELVCGGYVINGAFGPTMSSFKLIHHILSQKSWAVHLDLHAPTFPKNTFNYLILKVARKHGLKFILKPLLSQNTVHFTKLKVYPF